MVLLVLSGSSMVSLSPIWGGIIAGLVHTVMGPDHLSTIITLSACQGVEAFWFGVRWAAGHLAGMTVIGTVFALLHAQHGSAAVESYEHYADYLIGALLVFFGGYFLCRSDQYFDAEWGPKQKTCACHAHLLPADVEADRHHGTRPDCASTPPPPMATSDRRPASRRERKLGSPPRGHHFGACACPDCASERTPLQQHHSGPETPHSRSHEDEHGECGKAGGDDIGLRRAGSVLVGFVQGVACPAGILGLAFLKRFTSAFQIFIFVAIFFAVTTLAMGFMAMAYGMLTQRFVSSAVLGRTIYCASCFLSLALGCTWIYLNATGGLDAIFGHDHDHDHDHGHDHHHHDDGHDHDHGMSASMLLLLAAPR